MIKLESDLSIPVSRWLSERTMRSYAEVPRKCGHAYRWIREERRGGVKLRDDGTWVSHNRLHVSWRRHYLQDAKTAYLGAIDLVGVRWYRLQPTAVVAVELKKRLDANVIYQACGNVRLCHESWTAVASASPKWIEAARRVGIGVLHVRTSGEVVEIVQAQKRQSRRASRLARNAWRTSRGPIGGVSFSTPEQRANRSQGDPAVVLVRMRRYFHRQFAAGNRVWDFHEAYVKIKSHYRSFGGFYRGMRALVGRRRNRGIDCGWMYDLECKCPECAAAAVRLREQGE